MPDPTPESLRAPLEAALEAVRLAGEAVMEHFRSPLDVHYKSAEQPVTEADLAADRILRERLLRDFPDYGWLSEETADSRERLERSRVWIVDPIDGTNSFVEGRPEFVVSVGLAEEGRAVLGILHNPATGEWYHAVRGGGAFRNGEAIRVAPPRAAGEQGTMLASRSELRRGELERYTAEWWMQPLGSTAYRMAKISDGTAHVYASRGQKSEWDVCAAAVIVEEAGGVVTQIDGAPLRFNQPTPTHRGVVAGNGEPFTPFDPGGR